jgi:hypothetical protein
MVKMSELMPTFSRGVRRIKGIKAVRSKIPINATRAGDANRITNQTLLSVKPRTLSKVTARKPPNMNKAP